MNYFWHLRQDWIAEMLEIYGYINRKHLMRKFNISEIQASKDLTLYSKANLIEYDLEKKCYINSKIFNKVKIEEI
jgi:hypothetical protein